MYESATKPNAAQRLKYTLFTLAALRAKISWKAYLASVVALF